MFYVDMYNRAKSKGLDSEPDCRTYEVAAHICIDGKGKLKRVECIKNAA